MDIKKPKWMSDSEWEQLQRDSYNDLMHRTNNPSPAVKKGSAVAATLVMVSMVAFILCFIIYGIIQIVKAIFGG